MPLFPVTPDDVAGRWRPLSPAEEQVALLLLGDAEALLLTRAPWLPTRTVVVPSGEQAPPGKIDLRVVVATIADMVQAVLRNPDVQSNIQISSDGSLGQSWPTNTANIARPRLLVTDEHLAALTPTVAPAAVASPQGWYSVPYV